jgi:hypothetical protein
MLILFSLFQLKIKYDREARPRYFPWGELQTTRISCFIYDYYIIYVIDGEDF